MYKRLLVSAFGVCRLLRSAAAFPAAQLHEVQNFELPALSGPIDHMALSVESVELGGERQS